MPATANITSWKGAETFTSNPPDIQNSKALFSGIVESVDLRDVDHPQWRPTILAKL